MASLTARSASAAAASNALHLPRISPGSIQLRFWMLLAAVLGADALAIYGVHELVRWARWVFSS